MTHWASGKSVLCKRTDPSSILGWVLNWIDQPIDGSGDSFENCLPRNGRGSSTLSLSVLEKWQSGLLRETANFVGESHAGSNPAFSVFTPMVKLANTQISKVCAFGRTGSTPVGSSFKRLCGKMADTLGFGKKN
jgi:hypothetical protein